MYDENGNEIFGGVNLPAWSGDASLLLGFGGIQGRGKTYDSKMVDVANKAKQIAIDWKNPKETIKTDVRNTVERVKNAAKEFRDKLKAQSKGTGAHETGLKKVGIKETDLSRMALEERAKNGMDVGGKQDGNVAVYEYLDPATGKLVKRAFTTKEGSKRHAERHGWEGLEKKGIPPENVKRIYSELEPCELNGANCKACLNERFPNAEKTYSQDYPGSDKTTIPDRQQGKADRNTDFSRTTGEQTYPIDNDN